MNADGTTLDPMEKRAHHNALERKRRDHLKDSFISLKNTVPSLLGVKSASRALILKNSAEFIKGLKHKNANHQHDIDDIKRQNEILEKQIEILERANASGIHPNIHCMNELPKGNPE